MTKQRLPWSKSSRVSDIEQLRRVGLCAGFDSHVSRPGVFKLCGPVCPCEISFCRSLTRLAIRVDNYHLITENGLHMEPTGELKRINDAAYILGKAGVGMGQLATGRKDNLKQ